MTERVKILFLSEILGQKWINESWEMILPAELQLLEIEEGSTGKAEYRQVRNCHIFFGFPLKFIVYMGWLS